ncbi:MAG: NapC/NirT family cytochrome c [Ignavibacteriaceae bacterium]|nr:NapC/NirT family cytochrome c [Ignavibacteriaceae bacterium]
MKKLKYLLLLVSSFSLALSTHSQTKDECFNCHIQLEDKMAVDYKSDIHFEKGLSCAHCHGGDSKTEDMELAMNPSKGFKAKFIRKYRMNVCIHCHSDKDRMEVLGSKLPTDQYTKLEKSIHFQITTNNTGPVTDCITCHSVHNIKKVKDPSSKVYPTNIISLCGECHSSAEYMKNYNSSLPVDQVVKYRTSVHGKLNAKGDPNVADCADCHGAHDILPSKNPKSHVYASNIPKVCSNCHSDQVLMNKYKLPADQYDKFVKSVHGVALLEKGDVSAPSCNDCHGNHGAVPPGVESISKVCGSCHVINMELFEQSPHKKAFDENNYPECESCHGNHQIIRTTDKLIGVQPESVCLDCHKEADNNKGYFVAGRMKSLLDSLTTLDKSAKIRLDEATQKGMDVQDAVYSLKDIRQIILQSRTNIHTLNLEKFEEFIGQGYEIANKAEIAGQEAVDDYYFRRIGLGISTLVVTLLVIGLYFKLKKVEKQG